MSVLPLPGKGLVFFRVAGGLEFEERDQPGGFGFVNWEETE